MTESNIYKVFLAFGGNLGQPLAQFRHAVALLQQQPQIKRISCSPVYQTPAIGGPANQPDYLNAVVEIRTDMPADRLLHLCQQIEDQAGRTREVHWGPRTLDIDLLFFADLTIDTPELTLPHPRLHQRHFVLLPCTTSPEPDPSTARPPCERPVTTTSSGTGDPANTENMVS